METVYPWFTRSGVTALPMKPVPPSTTTLPFGICFLGILRIPSGIRGNLFAGVHHPHALLESGRRFIPLRQLAVEAGNTAVHAQEKGVPRGLQFHEGEHVVGKI